MEEIKLAAVESCFADIIWQHEPLASGELVKLCEKELSWKKSTTYTVLKKLCERGIFQNENGVVSSKIGRDQFYSLQSERFVENTFHGSLPAFVAAFVSRKALSPDEVAELRRMIDSYEEDGR